MREIEGIERVIARLRPHWDVIDQHFESENARFKELIATSHDDLGRILKCHLVVEHYLDRFLVEHYRLPELENGRFSFYQKAFLLPNGRAAAAFVKPGILRLNTIRNKFGHYVATTLTFDDLGAMTEVLRIARPDVLVPSPVDAVEAFTAVACAFLLVPPPKLQEVFADAFEELQVAVS